MAHQVTRRGFFQRGFVNAGAAVAGLSLPSFLKLRDATAAEAPSPRAKSCIVLFCWGGVSQLESWDPKPDAPKEYRGEFREISTATPGIRISEHLPLLAKQTEKLAIVRSLHHGNSAHGAAMYWNMTGHAPPNNNNIPPSAKDWPSLGAIVSKFRSAPSGLPPAVRLPYPLVDNNTLQAGEYGGWLGRQYDPIVISTKNGKPFGGVSRGLGAANIDPTLRTGEARLKERISLLQKLEQPVHRDLGNRNVGHRNTEFAQYEHFRTLAIDMLQSPRVQKAFQLDDEPRQVHEAYGEHICGKSTLLARRLIEAGVPLATVCCAAGDLNGSVGDHWDTHAKNFDRLKNTMLPTFDRAASALLTDLETRGMLEETLVVFLTEFGRTPKINGAAGRDHFPNCYSVVFAGGGIQGGQVYGRSDSIASKPIHRACGPADLHATIYEALGISPRAEIHDPLGRPFPICDGEVLPLFA